MKNLLTILAALTITYSTALASNTPAAVLIDNAEIEVVTVEALDIFTNAAFDSVSENLIFDTTKDISVVQIYDASGDLEFQLPVMSNNVQINKNLFDKGNYKLGFILEGQSQVHFTKVSIK